MSTVNVNPDKYNPITKWDKEKEYFKTAIVDQKSGTTWPYRPTDEAKEIDYHRWLNTVTDPMTGLARAGKEKTIDVSEDGVETERFIDKEPYQTVNVIQRERKPDKTEWLISKGYFTGFNQFGEPQRFYYAFLEKYQETVWNFRTTIDSSTGMMIKECLGPRPGAEITHYTMPFTPTNVDKLWNMSNKTDVSLLVKDMSVAGDPQAVPSIEMLKEKPFDYLKNKEYMSEKEKREELERFKLYQGEDRKTRTR